MSKGRLLAAVIGVATVAFVVIGTLWPVPSAVAYAGGKSLIAFVFHRTSSGGEPG